MIFPSVKQTQQEIQMKIPRPRQRGHALHVNIDVQIRISYAHKLRQDFPLRKRNIFCSSRRNMVPNAKNIR